MSAHKKRLFVGGLNSGTNEQDIRERLKTFGSVSSVEIHRRPKSEGFPEKTFAYVDIDALDSNIRKCITMLSNTKWKGGILKIQLAKESFLSRLQKEREDANANLAKSKSDPKESKSSSLPPELTTPIPNAVPGTLIPGKQNWVVGKFGRVLPVVHMRQKGGRKICRIDPSKTVHNLKRIKADGDEKPVSQLTWRLERDDDNNGNIINGYKHQDDSDSTGSSSSEELSVEIEKKKGNKNEKKSKETKLIEDKNRKRNSSSKGKQLSNEEKGHKKKTELNNNEVEDNDNANKNDSSTKSDSSDNENKETLLVNLKKKKKSKKKRKASYSSDSDLAEFISHDSSVDAGLKKKRISKSKKDDNESELEEKVLKNTDVSMLLDGNINLKSTDSEIQDSSQDSQTDFKQLDEKITPKKKEKMKRKKKTRQSKDGLLSENENGMTTEFRNCVVEKRRSENEQGYEEVKTIENKEVKKPIKIKVENTAKKLASNEKRLQAVKEREASSVSKQSIIASALKNLDSKDEETKKSNHIKFDEEYEENEQMVEENEQKKEGKISGSKASNWLGLDSASDDDDDDDDDKLGDKEMEDHIFAAKPQFEGQTGHKLFKLQKSYRGDSRFQLDERFAESDEESEPEDEPDARKYPGVDTTHSTDSEIEVSDNDNISKQLSREKDMSMSVLCGILGKNIGTKYDENSSMKQRFTDFSLIRYDPTRDDHAQFEQKPRKQDSPEPAVNESQQEVADVMRNAPEVTNEKYYDVKTSSLTELFGKKKSDDDSTPFTFLSNQDVTENTEAGSSGWGETEELRSKPWNPVMLPYDSSGDERDDMEQDEKQEHVQTIPEERFFFHFGDPELENRGYEEEGLFMRTQTIEQLNQHWIATRSDLTQDYKKKHKDALKRQSKMAAKKARMR